MRQWLVAVTCTSSCMHSDIVIVTVDVICRVIITHDYEKFFVY